ncbi:3-oxoacyl-ACP reductase FabG [Myxococcota bacterium]|nr:3-oxoacyl-ACP reductase FabG [Myxococcota bacterium]MBU1430888.1 3-oxoacyl-ACP reductase FabG [Myxococcota bacterium]MBU1899195.1 3-oxoacyl-ACP reductase FabG [Myxococcota bacterium]
MIALITGASRGIGRAAAVRLARDHQAKLFLVYRSRVEEAEAAKIACVEAGGEAEIYAADVSDPQAAKAAVEACVARFGRLDVLVNNAGITADGLVIQMSDEAWQDVIQTNLSGIFNTCRAAGSVMLRQKYGRVINLSSVSGKRPNRGQANYAASKGGIESFTRAFAVEMGRKGITVNAVAPGIIETEMSARVRQAAEKEIKQQIPLRRFGQPEEVAALISFLAGPDSGYITGQTIGIDGGIAL